MKKIIFFMCLIGIQSQLNSEQPTLSTAAQIQEDLRYPQPILSIETDSACPKRPRTFVYVINNTNKQVRVVTAGGFSTPSPFDPNAIDLSEISHFWMTRPVYCPHRGSQLTISRFQKNPVPILCFSRFHSEIFESLFTPIKAAMKGAWSGGWKGAVIGGIVGVGVGSEFTAPVGAAIGVVYGGIKEVIGKDFGNALFYWFTEYVFLEGIDHPIELKQFRYNLPSQDVGKYGSGVKEENIKLGIVVNPTTMAMTGYDDYKPQTLLFQSNDGGQYAIKFYAKETAIGIGRDDIYYEIDYIKPTKQ